MPRACALDAYSTIQSGVRWAETTLASCGTPKRVSISSACRMVSQSDLLPMMMPIKGCMTVGQTIVVCRLSLSKTDHKLTDHKKRWSVPLSWRLTDHKKRWSVLLDCQQLALLSLRQGVAGD